MVTAEPLSRAQAGDGEAFRELTESTGGATGALLPDARIYQNRTSEHLRFGAVPFRGSAASER
jgi:hypothetical protein